VCLCSGSTPPNNYDNYRIPRPHVGLSIPQHFLLKAIPWRRMRCCPLLQSCRDPYSSRPLPLVASLVYQRTSTRCRALRLEGSATSARSRLQNPSNPREAPAPDIRALLHPPPLAPSLIPRWLRSSLFAPPDFPSHAEQPPPQRRRVLDRQEHVRPSCLQPRGASSADIDTPFAYCCVRRDSSSARSPGTLHPATSRLPPVPSHRAARASPPN
jgi:hypothetical protein